MPSKLYTDRQRFAADIIADTYLITVPLHLLWNVRLPRSQRRLILAIFAASALSTFAGMVYAVLVLNIKRLSPSESTGFLIGVATDITVSYTLTIPHFLRLELSFRPD